MASVLHCPQRPTAEPFRLEHLRQVPRLDQPGCIQVVTPSLLACLKGAGGMPVTISMLAALLSLLPLLQCRRCAEPQRPWQPRHAVPGAALDHGPRKLRCRHDLRIAAKGAEGRNSSSPVRLPSRMQQLLTACTRLWPALCTKTPAAAVWQRQRHHRLGGPGVLCCDASWGHVWRPAVPPEVQAAATAGLLPPHCTPDRRRERQHRRLLCLAAAAGLQRQRRGGAAAQLGARHDLCQRRQLQPGGDLGCSAGV